MKKNIFVAFLLGAILLLPGIASAQGAFDRMISGILSAIWKIFMVVAVIGIVMSGVLFLTAQGDAKKLQTARQALLWGIIGVVVGIVAYSMVGIISRTIGA